MPRSTRTANEFWNRLEQTASGCWLWTGGLEHGYGKVRWIGKKYRTHRLAYELTHGAIPQGLHVLHHCDTPRCCNPAHLFLGTQADNMADMTAKGRGRNSRKGQKGYQHTGENNHAAKLTSNDVQSIRARHAAGQITFVQLAHEYHVSPCTIRLIVIRKTWKEVA